MREHAASDASVRGSLYKVFSMAFLYPSPEVVSFFRDSELPEVLDGLAAGHSSVSPGVERALVEELKAYLRSAECRGDTVRLESAYHALFHLEGGVSLYESQYRGAHEFQWAETLADLSGFYRAFGLEPMNERPDHLSVELEFMYALAFKEICALAEPEAETACEHLRITWEAERAFLRDHLAVWVPAFARALCRRAMEAGERQGGFYGRMSAWLERFLQGECACFDVNPSAAAVSPALHDAEQELACPAQVFEGIAIEGRGPAWAQAPCRWEIPEEGKE